MKNELIRIRCKPKTKKRFRVFVAKSGCKNMEEALNYLLDFYEGKVRTRISVEA